MSFFIHNENQKMLWNIISKTPVFCTFFVKGSPFPPEKWFKNIIEMFYRENSTRVLSVSELNVLNKQVITYMIQNLKQLLSPLPPSPTIDRDQYRGSLLERSSLPFTVENKQESYNRHFEERQKEYELMNMKPSPPKTDIGAAIKDEVITNIDEMVRLHMQQRDEELRNYSLPQPLTITKDANENIHIDVQEIDEEPKNKKTVSWSEEREDFAWLKSKVLELSNKIQELQEKMETHVPSSDSTIDIPI